MSWRIVIVTKCSKLDLKLGHLVVRNDEIIKVVLSEIHTLIIENTAVSLTVALLSELVKRKIKVIFCDEKRNPISELMPTYGSHDSSLKIKFQIKWDDYIKQSVWTEIVKEKLRNQYKLLEKLNLNNESKLVKSYIDEIEFNDESNREGHAAKVYFNALFGLKFTRSQENNINAALNYGYSILLSCFNREINCNGYLTQLGIFHDNMFNNYNLSSDLMEPFRTIIDECVKNMKLDNFEKEQKLEIIILLYKDIKIDGKKQSLTNAIKIYCRSIFKALNDRDISEIRFYRNEL